MNWFQSILFTPETGNPAQLPLWPCGHARLPRNTGVACEVCCYCAGCGVAGVTESFEYCDGCIEAGIITDYLEEKDAEYKSRVSSTERKAQDIEWSQYGN